jgi:hypothetical protein
MSSSQIEEAILENKVNFLTNRQPPRQPPSTEQ